MTLFLDTTDYNAILFAITDGKTVKKQSHKLKYNQNDQTLLLLDRFLKKHKISFPAIKRDRALLQGVKNVPHRRTTGTEMKVDRIIVCTGPGSFTGTRVGVTIAIALRFALGVKVVGIKKTQISKDLRKLATIKGSPSLKISYNRSF